MPAIIEKLSDQELRTDYYDAKSDNDIINRLSPMTLPGVTNKEADRWRRRLDVNARVMVVIENEAKRRGLTL
jgi:hypothetical protein